jgi:GPCR-Autoproteolysis INducing (GAIN) domain
LLTSFCVLISELATSTTSRPRPPWFPETPPNGWAELDAAAAAANVTTTTTSSASSSFVDDSDTEDNENEHDYSDSLDPTGAATPRVIKVKVPKPFPMGAATPPPSPVKNRLFPAAASREEEEGARLKDLVGRPVAQIPRSMVDPGTTANKNSNGSRKSKIDDVRGNGPAPVLSVANFTQFCPPVTARGLFWNWTGAGETAVLECPSGSIGFAKWRCGGQADQRRRHSAPPPPSPDVAADIGEDGGRSGVEWSGLSPSLVECQSKWLNNLDARLRDGEAVGSVSGDLAQLSGRQALYGGDLQLATRMLKHMAERMHYDVQGLGGGGLDVVGGGGDADHQESLVTELVQNVVLAASNVLDRANHAAWADLPADEAATAATALMIGLEENAFLLADSVTSEKIIIKPTTNICKYSFTTR